MRVATRPSLFGGDDDCQQAVCPEWPPVPNRGSDVGVAASGGVREEEEIGGGEWSDTRIGGGLGRTEEGGLKRAPRTFAADANLMQIWITNGQKYQTSSVCIAPLNRDFGSSIEGTRTRLVAPLRAS